MLIQSYTHTEGVRQAVETMSKSMLTLVAATIVPTCRNAARAIYKAEILSNRAYLSMVHTPISSVVFGGKAVASIEIP